MGFLKVASARRILRAIQMTITYVFGESGMGTFASLDLETLAARARNFDFPTVDDLYRPAAPFAPFNCDALTLGEVAPVDL